MPDNREKILELMKEQAYKPLTLEELASALAVPEEKKTELAGLVNDLLSDGFIIKTRLDRFGLASKMNLVVGELTCHPNGFGFVCPGQGEDVFIAPRRFSGAMHGDTVVARIELVKRGKKEGGIIRILKRAHRNIVGRFELAKGFGVVIPAHERILDRIIIPVEDSFNAKHGEMVLAEIVTWPEKDSAGIGRVIEILGSPESADVEAEVILRKYGLPSRFPGPVMDAAASVPMTVTEADIAGRTDLRDKKTVTIDGETAKDFDDAVSIDELPNGYKLRVSIADVSHYVKEGTAIDAEAYARGTSVYFPDRCVPMLPETLSNGICSLNPNVDRLTLTAEIDFDRHGNVTNKKFYESVIKSCERLTYTKVKNLISGDDAQLAARYAEILPDIKMMAELAALLSARRTEAGSIDFDLPEPQIIIDMEGNIEDIVRSERNVAHKLIEEFMLAANKAVAQEFVKRKLPFLYRIHAEPKAESIEEFAEFAAGFGIVFESGTGPKAFQKALAQAAGTAQERLINHVLLRSMKQAVYSDVNIGHFGLAFDDYTHFTSPIRRYPDLVVHRLLRLLFTDNYTKHEQGRMAELLPLITAHTSARERKAMEAEREVVDLKKAQFMRDKVGEVFEGFISGVTSFGIFVEMKEYFVEGLVHISALLGDYYIFDDKRHCLTGEHTKKRFQLGDEVTVLVTRVDLERRKIDLELVGEPKAKGRRGKAGKSDKSASFAKSGKTGKKSGGPAGNKGKRGKRR